MELPAEKIYTYADLLALGENVRAELICGDLYMMAPPSRVHRDIQGELHLQIGTFLRDKPCKIYMELGVRLFDEEDDQIEDTETLVIPDIAVICDHSKLDGAGCKGAPDLVIEILSPSTAKHDRIDKKKLYEAAGVREYWIVDQTNFLVDVFLLDENGKFGFLETYSREDVVKVNVLAGCEIDLSRVFPEVEVPKAVKRL